MKIVLNPFNRYTNDVFTYEGAKHGFIGATWIPLLYQSAKEKGIEVILAEEYLLQGQFSPRDLVISEALATLSGELLSTPAQPFIVFSGESPNIDWKFYTLLGKYTRPYKYACLFPGCKVHIHKETRFIPFYWPNDNYAVSDRLTSFYEKKHKKIAMIVGNKKQNSVVGNNRVKRGLKTLTMDIITTVIPSVKLQDLYPSRMKAIKFFSSKAYFDLYGRHWNNHDNLTEAERDAILKLAPTEVDDKYRLLSSYQFALCFENCVYPGYITEKIFDCFLSGCIPIYLGAPDIEKFIPENLFIDMRLFDTYEQLAEFIESFTEEQRLQYLERIANYLRSDQFWKFTDRFFSKTIMDLIKHEVSNCQY